MKIIDYWHNLNDRERWVSGTGSLCILLYLFYLLIYSPLSLAISNQSKQLIDKQETLAWMEQIQQQPKKKQTGQIINNSKLLAFIGNQLSDKAFLPFPYQLQQIGLGEIQLSFNSIPYKQILSWLWTLSNDYAITLKQFNAERSKTPGLIKVLIVIAAR